MNTKLEPDNKTTSFATGVLVALLFAVGAFFGLKDRLTPLPVIQTLTVEKVVEKVIVKRVATAHTNTVTNTVLEKKLFKAQSVDKDGNVINEWEVAKCKFRVIGATLTDRTGNTFVVQGNIRIRPINALHEESTKTDFKDSIDDAALLGDVSK